MGQAQWPFVRDVGAFLLGTGILVFLTLTGDTRTIAWVIGFACLGITTSGVLQRWLKGQTNGEAGR